MADESVLSGLGRKLDELDLTADEAAALHDILDQALPDHADVQGYASSGFGGLGFTSRLTNIQTHLPSPRPHPTQIVTSGGGSGI